MSTEPKGELVGATLGEIVDAAISCYPWAEMKKSGGIIEAVALAAQKVMVEEMLKHSGNDQALVMYHFVVPSQWFREVCAKLGVKT